MPYFRLLAIILALILAGCGVTVPKISEVGDRDIPASPSVLPNDSLSATAQIEWEIKKRIFCDLRKAVRAARNISYVDNTRNLKAENSGFLPLNWGARVSLSLQVDEAVALNPGINFTTNFANAVEIFGPSNLVTTAQNFTLGLGGSFSSTATRIDKFDSFYTIKRLSQEYKPESFCLSEENDPISAEQTGQKPAGSSPFVFESDLGIKDWLIGALFSTQYLPSDAATTTLATSGTIPDTITFEVKFVILSSGSVTPSWRLVRASVNTNNPLLNLGRTRTHDLIITIGPQNAETTQINIAQQIGNAVGSANRININSLAR